SVIFFFQAEDGIRDRIVTGVQTCALPIFSNKIFECIHAGLPVILSPVKEHQYLNDKYNFGIVVDEVSPKSIAEAVRKLKSNPELYSELRKNAIEASKVLNWENESKKLVKLYMQ